jgi:hypothetical protein
MYKMAISGGADRLLVLWNPFSSRPLGQLAGHVAPLVAVAVNEREHQVISAAADKTIKVCGFVRLLYIWMCLQDGLTVHVRERR